MLLLELTIVGKFDFICLFLMYSTPNFDLSSFQFMSIYICFKPVTNPIQFLIP